MKKLIIPLLLLLCAGHAAAVEFNDEIIAQAPGRETYFSFPSSNLSYTRTVRFFLPEGYEENSPKTYPVLYILGLPTGTQSPYPKDEVITVLVEAKTQDMYNKSGFKKFITEELALYTDVNFRTIQNAESRILLAHKPYHRTAVEIFTESKSFHSLMLPGASEIDIPEGHQFAYGTKIWFSTPETSAPAITDTLKKHGLKFGRNFIYTFMEHPAPNVLPYFLNTQPQQIAIKLSADKKALSIGKKDSALLSADVLVGGLRSDYIIDAVRLSPPLLDFNKNTAALTAISGAEKGKVKVKIEEENAGAEIKIKLVK